MNHMELIMSFLYFTAASLTLFMGLYVLRLRYSSLSHRLFFAACSMMAAWNIGLAMMMASDTVGEAMFWRRISSGGWSTAYSLTLMYILSMAGGIFGVAPAEPGAGKSDTGKSDAEKPDTVGEGVLRGRGKKLLYVALWIPAMVCLYVFVLSDDYVALTNSLQKGVYGWKNTAPRGWYDIFFEVYYISCLLGSLCVLRGWWKRAKEPRVKRQARLVFYSMLLGMLCGLATDVVIPRVFHLHYPKTGSLWPMIYLGGVLHAIRKHHLMREVEVPKEDGILNEESRKRAFGYMSGILLLGSLLVLASHVYAPKTMSGHNLLHISGILAGMAIFVELTRFVRRTKRRNVMLTIGFSLLIPAVIIPYNTMQGMTVWTFSVLPMIFALTLDSQMLLIGVTLSSIVTQLFLWFDALKRSEAVDNADFLLRISVLLLTFFMGLFVNRVYVRRLRSAVYQEKFQQILAELSADFLTVNQKNFNEKARQLLEKLGAMLECRCGCMYLIREGRLCREVSWNHFQCPLVKAEKEEVTLWKGYLSSGKVLPHMLQSPEDWSREGLEWEMISGCGVKKAVLIPLHHKGRKKGFLVFANPQMNQVMWKEQSRLLQLPANVLVDAIQKVETEIAMEHMAYYDTLTEMPNRSYFQRILRERLDQAGKCGERLGLIFLDLDGFKEVNDTLGHSVGDELLKEVGRRLKRCVNKEDFIGRFGGDEFLILADEKREGGSILDVVHRITHSLGAPVLLRDQENYVTASMGVAIYPADGRNGEELLKNADTAMYKAKEQGKNCCVFCTEELKKETRKRLMLSSHLKLAQERQELMVYYQPQVSAQTGRIIGVEALIRWNHKTLGMISPGIMIPLAEQNGAIHQIGEWILREAIHQSLAWQSMGIEPIRMAVNVSGVQFRDGAFPDKLRNILDETGIRPEYLELEITESITFRETDYMEKSLSELKEMGVMIAIDDFGTEYSSLSRLKNMPADRIKIDMQFIRGMVENQKDMAITDIIIHLARSLGLSVLAEGVETKEQRDILREKGCDEIQGYYFYRPMPADEVERLLRQEGMCINHNL